jgi:hypothetical protein
VNNVIGHQLILTCLEPWSFAFWHLCWNLTFLIQRVTTSGPYSGRNPRNSVTNSFPTKYSDASPTKQSGALHIWRTYILLSRVEAAFRAMKSPLCERPIFHHLQRRVETHIFLCVLAYHLLVCIERAFLEQGIHTSWETLRSQLSTHQVVTVRLPERSLRFKYSPTTEQMTERMSRCT